MKKILILTLSLSLQTILLSASELNWNFDLNTEAVRTAIKVAMVKVMKSRV